MSIEYCNEIWYGHYIPQEKVAVDDVYEAVGDDDYDMWVSEVNSWTNDEGLLVGEVITSFGPDCTNGCAMPVRDIGDIKIPSKVRVNEKRWREMVEAITGEKCSEYPDKIVAFIVR